MAGSIAIANPSNATMNKGATTGTLAKGHRLLLAKRHRLLLAKGHRLLLLVLLLLLRP